MAKKFKSAIYVLLCMVILAPVVEPVFAQGGITGTEESANEAVSYFDRVKDFFSKADQLTEEGKAIKEQVHQTAESQGWSKKLGSVWEAVSSFFSDKSVRAMLYDTGKLFLRLIANVFTLIAGVINKILAT